LCGVSFWRCLVVVYLCVCVFVFALVLAFAFVFAFVLREAGVRKFGCVLIALCVSEHTHSQVHVYAGILRVRTCLSSWHTWLPVYLCGERFEPGDASCCRSFSPTATARCNANSNLIYANGTCTTGSTGSSSRKWRPAPGKSCLHLPLSPSGQQPTAK